VDKIEQLWADFEVSARYDGLEYAKRTFKAHYHEDIVRDLERRWLREHPPLYAPEPLSSNKQSAPKNETSPITSTGDEEMDQVVQDLTTAPKPKRKQAYGKRQVDKDIAKDLILHFLNTDTNRRRKAFKIETIYQTVDWVNKIDERTMRRYLDELYKEGKVKLWKKPYILAGGQKVYHHWYTSATNPDPNFTLWVTK
jgi:hypothetical protein